MDIRSAAQVIRDQVDMDTILGLYGYKTKRGFMVCPFHMDSNASMKVYTTMDGHAGWHCFGCGLGGSVIDFVMEHESCDFQTAVRAIDNATGLHLMDRKEDPFRMEENRSIQRSADAFQDAAESLIDSLHTQCEEQIVHILGDVQKAEEKPVQGRTVQDWQTISEGNYEMQRLEDKKLQLDQRRKEVAAWRKKVRLLTAGVQKATSA